MTSSSKTLRKTALALALIALGLARAEPARAEGDGFGAIPVAIGVITAGGCLMVLDSVMLTAAIMDGESASLPWELLGLTLGGAGVAFGSMAFFGSEQGDAFGVAGLAGMTLGAALGVGAVYSMTLPSGSDRLMITPYAGGDGAGMVVAGRF